MKNNNLTKLVKGLLATAVLSMLLIACGNKSGDNNPQLNAFTQSCIGCEGITGLSFFSAQTKASLNNYYSNPYSNPYGQTAMTINWSFSGQNIYNQAQGQSQAQPNYQYNSPAMNYVGKVSAVGQVNITTAIGINNYYMCPTIPPGTYNLTTNTPGQWTNGAITGMRLIISGPVTMTVSLNQAQAYQYSSPYSSQYSATSYISGGLIVEQVNGVPCMSLQLNMNYY